MVIDSHNHLWLIDSSDLYWLSETDRAAGGVVVRDFGIEEISQAFNTVGVDKSVLIQAWNAEEDQLYWLDTADDNEVLGAVIAFADFADPNVGLTIDKFNRYSKFRGLRVNGQDKRDPDYLNQADIRRGIKQLSLRDGLTLDLLLKHEDLMHVPRIAEENPDLPMVLDHLAKPQTSTDGYFEPWASQMEPLRDIPNLKFKISGMLTEAGPEPSAGIMRPAVQFMIENYGFERLMWGSDWPVSLLAGSYKHNFDTTMAAVGDMTEQQRDMLLGGNAALHYQIP
tara:strand:+ start:2007 stop:2852 length:846 start_codon:yes stop_codon:yes gene_type:complete